ncbi:hypothetical protein PYK22_03209 [Pyrinomonas methylaliphatogenes]|uniref:Uncharacterized protein n=1 Tax=Pyrinomonas methylaliphatogenes TaxID=454194 RepID=A0A0B6X4N3_9BACT|nr:hypothetical protein PYK22_03209 [Pyrinomonas methylaliphatogenes]
MACGRGGDQTQEALETHEPDVQEPKPAAPEPLDEASPGTPRIPAQVVDNSRKPIRVRLLVKGYEGDILECGGVANPEAFPVGSYIWVQASEFDKKTRRIKTVRVVGMWEP